MGKSNFLWQKNKENALFSIEKQTFKKYQKIIENF